MRLSTPCRDCASSSSLPSTPGSKGSFHSSWPYSIIIITIIVIRWLICQLFVYTTSAVFFIDQFHNHFHFHKYLWNSILMYLIKAALWCFTIVYLLFKEFWQCRRTHLNPHSFITLRSVLLLTHEQFYQHHTAFLCSFFVDRVSKSFCLVKLENVAKWIHCIKAGTHSSITNK